MSVLPLMCPVKIYLTSLTQSLVTLLFFLCCKWQASSISCRLNVSEGCEKKLSCSGTIKKYGGIAAQPEDTRALPFYTLCHSDVNNGSEVIKQIVPGFSSHYLSILSQYHCPRFLSIVTF